MDVSRTSPDCPLCRRPKWTDAGRSTIGAVCEAETAVMGITGALADCRARALLVAALVAPVVDVVGYWRDSHEVNEKRSSFAAQVVRHYDCMKVGLSRLGGWDVTRDRLTIGPDGTFDEIVVHGALVHLERLDDNLLWLHVVAANGDEYKLDIHTADPAVPIGVLVLQQPATTTDEG